MLVAIFLVLFIFIALSIFISITAGRRLIYSLCSQEGKINFPIVMFGIAIIHFLFSWLIFGFMFAMGEGDKVLNSPIYIMIGVFENILLFFLRLVECFDKIYYNNYGRGIPNFIYFPVSFIVNSLLWGVICTWIINKISRRKLKRK